VWALRRRADNILDRWDGQTYGRILSAAGSLLAIAVSQTGTTEVPLLQVKIQGDRVRSAEETAVASTLERMLGLNVDLALFYRFAAARGPLAPLASRYRGMKPPRFATVFDSVLTAIAGQQITLTLAIRLLNRLAVSCGAGAQLNLAEASPFPAPERIANLSSEALGQLGFTRQRSRAILELARAVAENGLDLESLTNLPDDQVRARLQALRGVGRWTADYVMLRGLGRLHIFPSGDAGARNSLQHLLQLPEPLDFADVDRIVAGWHPYAGLVYLHLVLDHICASGGLA
jgi:DNA-3-methyladenine glycosylase II